MDTFRNYFQKCSESTTLETSSTPLPPSGHKKTSTVSFIDGLVAMKSSLQVAGHLSFMDLCCFECIEKRFSLDELPSTLVVRIETHFIFWIDLLSRVIPPFSYLIKISDVLGVVTDGLSSDELTNAFTFPLLSCCLALLDIHFFFKNYDEQSRPQIIEIRSRIVSLQDQLFQLYGPLDDSAKAKLFFGLVSDIEDHSIHEPLDIFCKFFPSNIDIFPEFLKVSLRKVYECYWSTNKYLHILPRLNLRSFNVFARQILTVFNLRKTMENVISTFGYWSRTGISLFSLSLRLTQNNISLLHKIQDISLGRKLRFLCNWSSCVTKLLSKDLSIDSKEETLDDFL
ncbi:hypothetical protein GEMRC1_003691 [Eukaryota sp. GEM-RC1]